MTDDAASHVKTEFPFLFYGSAPGDWAEGANGGHVYKVRFASAPDPGARATAEATFNAKLKGTRVDATHGPWKWEGAWACLAVGEDHDFRDPDLDGDDDEPEFLYTEFFAELRGAFKALHAAVPLAEVVMQNARGPSGNPWEKWTLATQPRPSKAPSFGHVALFYEE